MEDWHPALPQTEHTFWTVSGYRQPFLPLFCWLFGSDSPQGCQSLHGTKRERRQGVENGQGESCNKHLTAEERDGKSSLRLRYTPLWPEDTTAAFPLPLLMSLCHAHVLYQSLAKSQITGESSHTLKIHFLQTTSTSAPKPQEKPNAEQRSLRNLHQKRGTLTPSWNVPGSLWIKDVSRPCLQSHCAPHVGRFYLSPRKAEPCPVLCHVMSHIKCHKTLKSPEFHCCQ